MLFCLFVKYVVEELFETIICYKLCGKSLCRVNSEQESHAKLCANLFDV